MKFQITLSVEFEVNPEYYDGDKSPKEMLDIEIANYDQAPWDLAELCQMNPYKVTGKIIKE